MTALRRASMPDPAKLVGKSVTVLRRTGLTQRQALGVVLAVCEAVQAQDDGQSTFNWQWVEQVYRCAQARLERVRGD
jgi:hypothetical protein